MATHMPAHMDSILMGATTSILLGLLLLLPHAHAQNYYNPNSQGFNTLSNYNPNQPGYKPPGNLVGGNNPNQGPQLGYNNPQGKTPNYSPFMDLKGKYCETRPIQQCCPNRRDECSVPVMGTLCYCDIFCDRVKNPDCCPDFYSVCRGITPPPAPEILELPCRLDGHLIKPGDSYKKNCNTCKCVRTSTGKSVLECEQDPCMVNEKALETMKRDRRSFPWTAFNYSMFWGHKSEEGLLKRTGAIVPDDLAKRMYPILLLYNENQIPSAFDARNPPRSSEPHKEWVGKVGGVRDQGWCGSSWALSTLGVAEDRLAISSAVEGHDIKEQLSAQHLISCDQRGQQGCKGGHMDRVWMYLRKRGVVTESCLPYTSGNAGNEGTCPFPRRFSQSVKCPSGEDSTVYQFEPAYRISTEENDIKYEIMTNGPVQALMKVRDDFFMYQSGIYTHVPSLTNNDNFRYHAVRIVGWGTEGNRNRQTKFWHVANTWGRNWGERGFFRIKRGSNESEIESFILAVRPRLDKYGSKTRQRRLSNHKQAPQSYIRKNHHHSLKHNAGY